MIGINLNFTASGVSIPMQLDELREHGFKKVRLNIVRYNTSQAAIDTWRGYTQYALKLGFERVIWGAGAGTGLTSANYADYRNGILLHAEWFEAQDNSRLEFQIGNEEELHHDASLPNGTLRANLRQLATDCQAIYTKGPISYSSSIFTGNEIGAWTNEGLGGLDRIGFNLYGSDNVFAISAQAIVTNFDNKGFVSEWGTSNGYHDFNNESLYEQAINKRRKLLINSGVEEAYYYNYMESGNKWGIKMYPITGDHRIAWPVLLGVRPWFTGNPNTLVARNKTPQRNSTPNRTNTPNRIVL